MHKEQPLLPDEFAKTGIHAQTTGTPITRYQVLGERSSGTNFVKRLLGRNSNLKPVETLGWKHGFPQMMAIPSDLAVVCVVRNAESWALSMFSKPWHTSRQMQKMGFSEFIRAPWDTTIDRPRYFEDARQKGIVGQPLQQDRHPMTGEKFANLFALRQAKLVGLLSYLNRDCSCILVNMEAAQNAPENSADHMLSLLGQPARTQPFRPVVKRLGAKFKPSVSERPAPPASLSAEDRAFLIANVDIETEAWLGNNY